MRAMKVYYSEVVALLGDRRDRLQREAAEDRAIVGPLNDRAVSLARLRIDEHDDRLDRIGFQADVLEPGAGLGTISARRIE